MDFDLKFKESRKKGMAEYDEKIKLISDHVEHIKLDGLNKGLSPQEINQQTAVLIRYSHDVERQFVAAYQLNHLTLTKKGGLYTLCGTHVNHLHTIFDRIHLETLDFLKPHERCKECWEHKDYDLAVLANTGL